MHHGENVGFKPKKENSMPKVIKPRSRRPVQQEVQPKKKASTTAERRPCS